MDGIRILAEKTPDSISWVAVLCLSALCVIMVGILIYVITVCIKERDASFLILGMSPALILSVTIPLLIYCVTSYIPSQETTYKVIVSDDVSLNEFLNKYEIISQEGEIYEVREKK